MNENQRNQLSLFIDYAEVARQYGWDPKFIDAEDHPALMIGRTDKRVLVTINGKPDGAKRFVGTPYIGADGFPLLKITGTTEITDTETINGWLAGRR